MGKTIVITSGKGGVGKTTIAANLASALAQLDYRVCIVDADLGLKNVDILLNLENRVIYDIVDVIRYRVTVDKALIPDKYNRNLFLLAGSHNFKNENIFPHELERVTNELKKYFDFVIVDSSAGIESNFDTAIKCADTALVIAKPELTSIRDADRVIGLLDLENLDKYLIINNVDFTMIKNGSMVSLERTIEVLGINLLGVLIKEDDIIKYNNIGKPIVYDKGYEISEEYFNIANRLLGHKVPLMKYKGKKKNKSLISLIGIS